MNIVLVNGEEVRKNRVLLKDHRAKHIVKVLRSEVGETIKMGVLHGQIGEGRILKLKTKFPFEVEVELSLTHEAPDKCPIDLILALPRPIMLRRILSQGATLGFANIHIINANRVEKSFWESGVIEKEEYMEHLIHGLEQAVDTIPPKIFFHRRFKPFVEDYFPAISDEYSDFLLAHPASHQRLGEVSSPIAERILLAIGPEGGWVDYEEEKFMESGFRGFTIGGRILKVDTAVMNIHGRIMTVIEKDIGEGR